MMATTTSKTVYEGTKNATNRCSAADKGKCRPNKHDLYLEKILVQLGGGV